MKDQVVTLLVQDRQHLRKMLGLIPLLPASAKIHLLLDDIFLRADENLTEEELRNDLIPLSKFLPPSPWLEKEKKTFSDYYFSFVTYLTTINWLKPYKPAFRATAAAMRRFFKRFFPYLYAMLCESVRLLNAGRWRAGEAALRNYVATQNPALLILAEGNVQYVSEAFIKIFHDAGIASYIAPYTFCTAEEPANYYKDNLMFKARWYLHSGLRPQWYYTYQGERLIRLPYLLAKLYDKFGYTPPQPWVLESSTADGILVESEAMRQHYLSQGIPAGQLQVIGDTAHDRIYENFADRDKARARFLNEHNLNTRNSKWLVFAVYPDLSNKFDDSYDFKTYEESLDAIIDHLSKFKDWDVILSIHPSLDARKFDKYTSQNVHISKWPATDIVGLCDLYVASISATIRWAIATSVPVINYDIYRFKYADYKDVPGVITVDNWADFQAVTNKAATDGAYLASLAAAQKNEAAKWGVIDGQFKDRFRQLFAKYIHSDDSRKAA